MIREPVKPVDLDPNHPGLDATLPDNEEVDGAALLDEVRQAYLRFVVLDDHQATALALWTMHTHAFGASDTTPYLSISSAEKRAGKTRTLEVAEHLVARPWFTGRVTSAVLARKIDKETPTLLLDESDAAFHGDREYAETLRGILNTGYKRGGKSSICEVRGANIGYRDLATFCPKAIAGIGKLPDTVADRSIPIVLQRKKKSETIERFRYRQHVPQLEKVHARVQSWAAALNLDRLRGAEPAIPDELGDRAADVWEPLLGIADLAGGEWPERARKAAIALSGEGAVEDDSLGVRLLVDIRHVFDKRGGDRIASADLAAALSAIEGSPWGPRYGQPFDARRLAHHLKPFGITPKVIRIGGKTPSGYKRKWFTDAWERYCPVSPTRDLNKVNNPITTRFFGHSASSTEGTMLRLEMREKTSNGADVEDVEDKRPGQERGRYAEDDFGVAARGDEDLLAYAERVMPKPSPTASVEVDGPDADLEDHHADDHAGGDRNDDDRDDPADRNDDAATKAIADHNGDADDNAIPFPDENARGEL